MSESVDRKPNEKLILQMKGITKRFGEKVANDRIDFDLREGEVHALLGENGAGKSTLMNILYGLYKHDSGFLMFDGKQKEIHSPADALKNGIGMVQQHFTLVPSFTVAENVMMGTKDERTIVNTRLTESKFKKLSQDYGLEVPPKAKVWQLSVVEKQRVEILKLLYLNARVIILDEPTAVLTPQEGEVLFSAVEKMKKRGASVVFITHKLKEVMSVADRITVLRNGQNIGTTEKSATDKEKLAKWMVGRNIVLNIEKGQGVVKEADSNAKETTLRVNGLSAENDQGLKAIDDISLEVRKGEILGIAGVGGNGQRELAECIYGLRKTTAGTIEYFGRDITSHSIRWRIKKGIAYIPQDRKETGTCPNLSIYNNLAMKASCKRGFWVDRKQRKIVGERLIRDYKVDTTSGNMPVKYLSGGNMQKLILAREFSEAPGLIIAEHPTRGLDVGAMEFVYQTLIKARDKGVSVLLLAGDLDEIFNLSDRVAVIYEGRIMGYSEPSPEKINEIGLMMAGEAS